MADVFVSYKRENVAVVGQLVAALRGHGLDVWWDVDIPPNAPWEETIERQLETAGAVLVAWSKAAVLSENVKAEARWARRNDRLLQAFVETCEPPLFFGERQGVDLRGWSGDPASSAIAGLVAAIRAAKSMELSPLPDAAGAPPRLAQSAPGGRDLAHFEGVVLNGIFEVRRLVGRGALGAVYEGVNVASGERLAIKLFDARTSAMADVRDSFLRSARLVSRLSHPAIAGYRLAAADPTLGVLYTVQEFVDGIPLGALIGQVKAGDDKVRALARRLAEALDYVHGMGVVHRQVMPDNIILANGRFDSCKIVDFGVITDSDAIPEGSLHALYAAPEQLGAYGGDVGPWTDVYSLGRVLLALVTGAEPAPGAGLVERPPRVLGRLLAEMVAENPESRLRSMDAVLARLDAGEGGRRGVRRGARSRRPAD